MCLQPKEPNQFLLGDFAAFARFCALAQANDLIAQSLKRDEPDRSDDQTNGSGRNGVELEEDQNEW